MFEITTKHFFNKFVTKNSFFQIELRKWQQKSAEINVFKTLIPALFKTY